MEKPYPRKNIKMKKRNISIGVLSHNAPNTLENTLLSYERSGLLRQSTDIFCVLQYSQRQQQEVEVCARFNIRSIIMNDNGLMSSGFKQIYNSAKNNIIMFLENDFCTYCSAEEVEYYLDSAIYFLENKQGDIVRGRSRTNSGYPNHAIMNLSKIDPKNFISNTHLCECMYWVDHPEIVYPTKIYKIASSNDIIGQSWYLTDSSGCNYTNNPYMCTKDFFEKAVYPYLNDSHNIESILTPIWARERHKCVFGFGIFTHDRKDGH